MTSVWRRVRQARAIAYSLALSLGLSVPSLVVGQGPTAVVPPPREFASAEAHYTFLLDEADGGTRHSAATLPDWAGVWIAGGNSLDHPVDAPLTPAYRARYQELQRQMADDGEVDYDRLSGCEPTGYPRWLFVGASFRDFMLSPDRAVLMAEHMNETRRVYTDGRSHYTPEGHTWLGDSIGFWDSDKLVIWTLAVKAADYSRGYPETSDQLQGVEVWRPVAGEEGQQNRIVVQATIYDPVGLTAPWPISMAYDRIDIDYRIRYWECATTNVATQDEEGRTIITRPGEANESPARED